MESFLFTVNSALSKLCVPLALCLCIIAVLRMVAKGRGQKSLIARMNKGLRKLHIPLAIVLACAAVLHTILSFAGFTVISSEAFGLVWGIICLVFIGLLFLNYFFRKKLKPNWMLWHRILASGFFISLILHMREVESLLGGH